MANVLQGEENLKALPEFSGDLVLVHVDDDCGQEEGVGEEDGNCHSSGHMQRRYAHVDQAGHHVGEEEVEEAVGIDRMQQARGGILRPQAGQHVALCENVKENNNNNKEDFWSVHLLHKVGAQGALQ